MDIQSANTILYCRDWEAAKRFYGEILNLRPSFKREDWFIEYAITPSAHISIADAARCSVGINDGVGLTLSFFVEDLAATRERFVEHGVEATEIKAHGWRLPYFFVYDPEGTRIEFWSRRQP